MNGTARSAGSFSFTGIIRNAPAPAAWREARCPQVLHSSPHEPGGPSGAQSVIRGLGPGLTPLGEAASSLPVSFLDQYSEGAGRA